MLELRYVQPQGRDLLEQQWRVLHRPRAWQGAGSLPRTAPCQCHTQLHQPRLQTLISTLPPSSFPPTSTSEGHGEMPHAVPSPSPQWPR